MMLIKLDIIMVSFVIHLNFYVDETQYLPYCAQADLSIIVVSDIEMPCIQNI